MPHLLCGLHTLEYLRRYVYAVLLFKLNAASFIFNFLLPPPKYGNKKAERAGIKFMPDEACVCVWAPILSSDAQKLRERLKLRIIVENTHAATTPKKTKRVNFTFCLYFRGAGYGAASFYYFLNYRRSTWLENGKQTWMDDNFCFHKSDFQRRVAVMTYLQ